jgi:hypothetical protein
MSDHVRYALACRGYGVLGPQMNTDRTDLRFFEAEMGAEWQVLPFTPSPFVVLLSVPSVAT